MRRMLKIYREVIKILFAESPFVVISVILSGVISGVIVPLSVWINSQIFNNGLAVASNEMSFREYIPYLVLFVVLSLLPILVGDMFMSCYAKPRCQLILRTAYKSKMLQKLKKLRYEHLESKGSMEIIDKAYNATEGRVLTLFPDYTRGIILSLIAAGGTLYFLASARWWLLPVALIPFALETYLLQKSNYNIYNQMERFWLKDRSNSTVGNMLRSRDYIKENKLLGASDYLIDTYRKRMNERNREYEHFFFKHLRHTLGENSITKIAQIIIAILLFGLYRNGDLDIGMMVALTLTVFSGSYMNLSTIARIIRTSGNHIIMIEFYEKYFDLSEDEYGDNDSIPNDFTIEFDNVFFTYPGTEKQILKGLSLIIKNGEKISVVGENGEGKSTMIKLLLGLFQPDSGEIRIGGKPLSHYSEKVRSYIFAPVFQDFVKYSISLGENIGIGDVDNVYDSEAVAAAMRKAKVDDFVENLTDNTDTLLGRDFDGGVDLSGGQWQRIAIARAFMGNKPILILDEPTSQLDPMAESKLYSEFTEMSENKTAVFITHRLGSTVITDRIFVIDDGKVTQSGSHNELMEQGGLYADMFNAQKQWYIKNGEGEADNV